MHITVGVCFAYFFRDIVVTGDYCRHLRGPSRRRRQAERRRRRRRPVLHRTGPVTTDHNAAQERLLFCCAVD